MKKNTALGLAISMALTYPVALSALGLGEIQSTSQLNQPLRAQIDLISTTAKEAGQLQVKLASPEVFSRVGIDRPPILENLRFTPTMQNGKPVIMVSSDQPLNEPFLNFLLEVSWPQGQLLKEYTVLLDPPVLLDTGKTGADNAASVRAEPKSTGVVTRPSPSKPASAQPTRSQIQVSTPPQGGSQQQIAQDILAQQAAIAAREEASSRSQTSSTSAVRQKYRVKRGDTLRKVATKFNQTGVTSDQMMVALFRANPQAFFGDNINNLKAGAVISKPGSQQLSSVSQAASQRLVKQHYAEWKDFRGKLAKNTSKQTEVSSVAPSSGTKVSSPVASANEGKQANLKVVGSDSGKKDANNVSASASADVKKLNEKLALAEEALASSKSENAELETRLSKLEAILRKKDRLIELKNDRLAKLEQRLGEPAQSDETILAGDDKEITSQGLSSSEIVEPEVASIDDSTVSTGSIDQLVQEVANEEESNRVIRNDDGLVAVEESGAQQASVDEPRIEDPFAQPKKDESGILDLLKSPAVAAVGIGSLLTLILGMLYMRRRANHVNDDDSDFILEDEYKDGHKETLLEEDFQVNQFDDSEPSAIDDIDKEFQEASPHGIESNKDIDELDSILSEEKDEDEVIQEADVYIVYGLHEQAEEELTKAISEKPNRLDYRVKLLENYEAAKNSDGFMTATRGFLAANGDNKQAYWDKIVVMGRKMLPDSELFGESNVTAASALFGNAEESSDDIFGTSSELDTAVSESNETLEGFSDDFIDFSNDTVDLDEQIKVTGVEESLDGDDFDFGNDNADFGIDELADDLIADNTNVLDFDSASKNKESKIQGVSLDINNDNGIDKILPTDSSYAPGSEEDELDDALSFLDLSDDDQEMQEAHIGTKLDLARAYLDMGDVEGARCTLEEVVVEGNEDQKREAEELLQQTG